MEHYDAHGDSEWACGGDDDCDAVEREPDCVEGSAHRWTSEGMGGCTENPGVWSRGGTTIVVCARCRLCGCVRHETCYGDQRNPGQCDRVRYEQDEHEPEADALRQARRNRRAPRTRCGGTATGGTATEQRIAKLEAEIRAARLR